MYIYTLYLLLNRTETVALCGVSSDEVPVTSGVRQDSVFGLVLFIFYLNDLHCSVAYHVHLFTGILS